jgi:hypothetical protein
LLVHGLAEGVACGGDFLAEVFLEEGAVFGGAAFDDEVHEDVLTALGKGHGGGKKQQKEEKGRKKP